MHLQQRGRFVFHSPWINTMYRCAFLAAICTAAAMPAAAQEPRNFPASALRGEISITQPPDLSLNGQPARLAPGARIRGQNNLLLLSGALVGQRLVVHYTRDPSGNLLDVWVLTPAELARRPWPTTPEQAATWSFNPDAQVWSRP
ncbi:MAG TPA: hypothetical protein VEZ89_04945 [Rubrivivax sp.]|nr:hypothetical protein [Rubrivivax sp.]